MKKLRKAAPALCCLALLLLCWSGSLLLAGRLAGISQGVSVRYSEGTGVSPSDIGRIVRYARQDGSDSLPGLTLWREKRRQSLSADGFRRTDADILEVCGDGGFLLPIHMRAGSLPAQSDTGGCAIDETLAQALWGSGDVLGKKLTYEGVTYTVRGVFSGAKNLMFVQGEQNSQTPYPALLMTFPQGTEGGVEKARSFLTQNSLPSGEIFDIPLLSWAMEFLAALPAFVLTLCLLGKLLWKAFRLRHTPLLLGLFLLPAAGSAALGVWTAGIPAFPARLIPTQWSDFGYWSRLFAQNIESAASAFRLTLTARDLALWQPVFGGLFLSLASAVLALYAAKKAKPRSLRGWGIGTALWFTGVFAAALLFADSGLEVRRGFWLTLPVIWACAGWMGLFEDFLKGKEDVHEAESHILEAAEQDHTAAAPKF